MSGGTRKTKDKSGFKPTCFEKSFWRPSFIKGRGGYSLLKPSESGPFKPTFASEHNNRHIDM